MNKEIEGKINLFFNSCSSAASNSISKEKKSQLTRYFKDCQFTYKIEVSSQNMAVYLCCLENIFWVIQMVNTNLGLTYQGSL